MTDESLGSHLDKAVSECLAAPLAGIARPRRVDATEWIAVYRRLRREAVEDDGLDGRRDPLGATTPEPTVATSLQLHRFAFDHNEEFVGGYMGREEAGGRYRMCFSAVMPSHRRLGIYRDLIARILTMARSVGFSEVVSCHKPDNNAVLIPKLQAGFLITGMEITSTRGILVKVAHPLRELNRSIYRCRIDGREVDALRSTGALSTSHALRSERS